MLQKAFGSKQFVKHLLLEFKKNSNISQAISLQKCIQIADIFSLFLLQKCLLTKCKKKVSKSVEISRKLPVKSSNILLTHTKHTKMLVQSHSRLNTDNWFFGRDSEKPQKS
jgi:hypothetical protein